MLILGSSSKARQALLRRLLIPFDVAHPDTDETALANESPTELVLRLAEQKARDVAIHHPHAIIIGADQVGVVDDHILGKPTSHEHAIEQLQRMSGQRISYHIGLSVLDAPNQRQETVLEKYDVVFRELTREMIEHYLQKEDAFACAGSFKAEGLGIALVKEFHGADFSALIGLPLIRLVSMLGAVGVRVV